LFNGNPLIQYDGSLPIAENPWLPGMIYRLRAHLTPDLAKEMVWVVSGQLMVLCASVLCTKVFASQLGQEQYGRLALGLTLPVLINQFFFGPITTTVVRYYSAYQEAGLLRSLLSVVYRFVGGLTGIFFSVGAVVCLGIARVQGFAWGWIFFSALVYGLLQNAQSLLNGMQVAARRRANAAIHQALDPCSRLLLGGLAILCLGKSAEAAVTGYAVGMTLVLLSQRYWFNRTLPAEEAVRPDQFQSIRATLWNFAKYIILFGCFTWGPLVSDRWGLKIFLGDASVGLYAVVVQLASVPSVVLAGSLHQLVNPIVFQRAGDASDSVRVVAAMRVIRLGVLGMMAWIGFCAMVAAWLGAPILEICSSPAYRSGAPYLPLVVVGLGLMQVGHMLGLIPMIMNDLRLLTVCKIVHSLVAVIINIAGAWLYGVMGIALACIITGVLYVGMMVWNNAGLVRVNGSPDAK